jgi:hypothetical protein
VPELEDYWVAGSQSHSFATHRRKAMSHEQKSNKMDKKKALSTPKEKKAAKKMKKDIKEGIHKPKIV